MILMMIDDSEDCLPACLLLDPEDAETRVERRGAASDYFARRK